MGDYEKLALVHGALGMEMFALGFLGSSHADEAEEAMFIIGYLFYVVASILSLLMVVMNELKGNQIAQISTMACFWLAALFILCGWAIWADNHANIGNSYAYTLDVTSTCMAIIAGVFILLVAMGKGGSSSSSGGGKTAPETSPA